ncbi:MAG: undecaprenyl-diphosphate phosphatase [Promethearchaeota archaeon]|nr:MAG: undecaprenyl-diphosphate phosphatase [Candidatus Lokiarchaeota archaeon]
MVALWLILILAVIQGILEWLPVSSEGQLVLILTWLQESEQALAIAIFLHLGTMIAVIIRFRNDFLLLFNWKLWGKTKTKEEELNSIQEENTSNENLANDQEKKNYSKNDSTAEKDSDLSEIHVKKKEQRILWKFLLVATLMTGIIGVPIYLLLEYALSEGELLEFANGRVSSGDIITIGIGLFLIATGLFILFSRRKVAEKELIELSTWEMILVGATQGLAIIPGVSRSGTTMGTLLIRSVKDNEALRGSFLLSVPAVLGGNILLIIIDLIQGDVSFEGIPWYGMILAIIISGVVGYITIDLFLWIARKINFGWFCLLLGGLAVIITLIMVILSLTTTKTTAAIFV